MSVLLAFILAHELFNLNFFAPLLLRKGSENRASTWQLAKVSPPHGYEKLKSRTKNTALNNDDSD